MRGAVTGEDSVVAGDVALMSWFFQPVNQRLDDAASNRCPGSDRRACLRLFRRT